MVRIVVVAVLVVAVQAGMLSDPESAWATPARTSFALIGAAIVVSKVWRRSPVERVEGGDIRTGTDRLVAVTLLVAAWGSYLASDAPTEILPPVGAAAMVAVWWLGAAALIWQVWRLASWADDAHEAGVRAALAQHGWTRPTLIGAVAVAAALAWVEGLPQLAVLAGAILPLVAAAIIRATGRYAVTQIELEVQGHVDLLARHLGALPEETEVLSWRLAGHTSIDQLDVRCKVPRASDADIARALDRALDESDEGWEYNATSTAGNLVTIRGEYVGHVDHESRRARRQVAAGYGVPLADVVSGPEGGWVVDLPDGLSPDQQQRVEDRVLARLGDGWRIRTDWLNDSATIVQQPDPLAQPIMWPGTPGQLPDVSLDRIPIGILDSEDDRPTVAGLKLLETHTLVGGVPGSGKSGWAAAYLAAVAQLEHVALVGVDPKRVELSPWKPRFSTVATTVETAARTLAAVFDESEARYEALAAVGRKKVTPDLLDRLPLLVVVIDELAEITAFADGGSKEERALQDQIRGTIRRLIQKARAAGICLTAMTQKPMADVVPTTIRDNMQLRISFATTTAAATTTILGEGMAPMAPAHQISTSMRGVGYLLDEQQRIPQRFRAWWLPEAGDSGAPAGSTTVEQVIHATAHQRVELPWIGRDRLSEHGIAARAEELVALLRGEAPPPAPTPVDPAHEPTGEIPPVPHEPTGEHPPVVDDLEGW